MTEDLKNRKDVEEIADCPFCGHGATLIKIDGVDGWRDRYAVRCDYMYGGCGAEGGWRHYKDEAIDAWNNRVKNPKRCRAKRDR